MRERSAVGYVYFVLAAEVGRVKIGYSASHPEKRLAGLQTGCPVRLSRLGFIRGNELDETHLHDRFVRYRAVGEWFDYSQEIRDFVRRYVEMWTDTRPSRGTCRSPVRIVRITATLTEAAEATAYHPTRGKPKPDMCAGRSRQGQCRQCDNEPTVRAYGRRWCVPCALRIKEFPSIVRDLGQPILPEYCGISDN